MARIPYANHNLGPVPEGLNEVQSAIYERKIGRNTQRQGTRQAEEQLVHAGDNIRGAMYEGAMDGDLTTAAGHVMPYRRQGREETVSRRAAMGGAEFHPPSWVDVDGYLAGFAHGASGDGEQVYEVDRVDGRRYGEANGARIRDDL